MGAIALNGTIEATGEQEMPVSLGLSPSVLTAIHEELDLRSISPLNQKVREVSAIDMIDCAKQCRQDQGDPNAQSTHDYPKRY